MKKKAFTLIELLAVIIILAVIALIATPIVLNVVQDAREKARQESIHWYSEAVILTNAENQLATTQTDLKVGANAKMKGETVTCETVVFNDNYGAVLDNCTVGSDTDYVYYYDGSNVLTTRPDDMDERLNISVGYKDESGASQPPLMNGMVAVLYDGTNWKVADTKEKWYDYNSKEWANAVVFNDGVTKEVGDTIDVASDVALMFVWVPRFEYKLPADSLGTTETPKAIDIKFIPASQTTADSGYSIHPGFTFGGENKEGIWFGKFESSAANRTTNSVQKIIIKPNVQSWVSVQAANMFTSSRNLETDYSLTGYDSHMARYLEWTTASYLTNSIYGRCSDADTCTEVTINNSSNFITGNAGTKISDSIASGTTNAYDTAVGVLASTTGNIYGIYDMSGGANEYVMGLLERENGIPYVGQNSTFTSGFNGINAKDNSEVTGKTALPDSKYYDVFTSSNKNTNTYSVITAVNGSSSMNGVFKELMGSNTMSYTNWYGDSAYSVDSTPWFALGGDCLFASYTGVFCSNSYDGYGNAFSYYSFRVVLVAK